MSPVRIQRKRTKGWRMPEGAVYVGRPSRWGNPWSFQTVRPSRQPNGTPWLAEDFVRWYRQWLRDPLHLTDNLLAPLRGRDLVCWCPLDQPCHADVLLELANR